MQVERRHERSAADRSTAVGRNAGRGTGHRLGVGRLLPPAGRRVRAAAGRGLHPSLQAALGRRTPLKRRPRPALGQEAGRPARTSASRPHPGPARGSQPGHRLQAAAMPLVRRRPVRRRPRTAPASSRRGAAGPARGGRVSAPSPDLPTRPHLRPCEAAARGARRSVRPPAAGDPRRPGRGLPPGQAAYPGIDPRPARPVDLRRGDLPTGAARRRRPGGPGRGAASARPHRRLGPHRRDVVVAGPGEDGVGDGRDEDGDGLHHRQVTGGRRRQEDVGDRGTRGRHRRPVQELQLDQAKPILLGLHRS